MPFPFCELFWFGSKSSLFNCAKHPNHPVIQGHLKLNDMQFIS